MLRWATQASRGWKRALNRRRRRAAAGRAARRDPLSARMAALHDRFAAADRAVADARRALARGDALGAELAAHDARRRHPDHPAVPELIAQTELMRGRPHHAVDTLTRRPALDERGRLLLALARCQAGDIARARLDLRAWGRAGGCTVEARVLLSTLELADGDEDAARRALGSLADGRHLVDPLACQMLVLIDLAEDLTLAAERAAGLLAHAFTRHGFSDRWLATLDLTPRSKFVEPARELIDRLARQLIRRPELIPTLARAQREEPAAGRIRLLRRALTRIVDDVAHPAQTVEALAELAELSGDLDDAARWARRGLAATPYSAKLGLLLDRVTEDRPARSDAPDDALDALERAAARFPQYADVRRALILRYRRGGQADRAVRAAERWLADAPDSAIAAHTRREIAA